MMPSGQRGFRLFRFAGIDVFLHWSWFVVAAYELQERAGQYSSFVWNVAEYLALFLIVTLHEFGHSLACRQVGGAADHIVLWPLGGVAYVRPPQRPGATLWSIAAGPLVNVVLIPVLIGLGLLGRVLGPGCGGPGCEPSAPRRGGHQSRPPGLQPAAGLSPRRGPDLPFAPLVLSRTSSQPDRSDGCRVPGSTRTRRPRRRRGVSMDRHPRGVRRAELLASLSASARAVARGEAATPPRSCLPLVQGRAPHWRAMDMRAMPEAIRRFRSACRVSLLRSSVCRDGLRRLWQAASDRRVGCRGRAAAVADTQRTHENAKNAPSRAVFGGPVTPGIRAWATASPWASLPLAAAPWPLSAPAPGAA